MFSLKAKIRQKVGGDLSELRRQGVLPAVLYGEGIKESLSLQVSEKDFTRVYQQAGESSMVKLQIEPFDEKQKLKEKETEVLIHQTARDSLTERFLHVDFFHPSLAKKIEAEVPLLFEGVSPAVKDLGAVLVKELQEMEVKGLAHKLPREIKVNIDNLKNFGDKITVGDLELPEGVEISRAKDEIVVHITEPQKVEEERVEKAQEAQAEGETEKKGVSSEEKEAAEE